MLVKWWLLAIPHDLIVAIVTGGAWSVWSGGGDGAICAASGGLIGLLVLFAALSLLFTRQSGRCVARYLVLLCIEVGPAEEAGCTSTRT